ncbi:MAG: DUF421 domain-containing protein [Muribaculaceae bacterium]|nr:DUF421 domain-containing protein [Muribaculaceae bacterium]
MLPDIGKVIITSLVSILVLFLLCRLIGQRQISQMSLFDYINGICIGSIAAEFATNLEEWYRPLTAMVIYGFAAALINLLTCKSLALRKFFNGKPLVLFEDGRLYKGNLYRAKLDINEFLTQCRVAGYFDLSQLGAVVLETNGQLSFLPLAAERPLTPADMQLKPQEETLQINLILDGKILQENLRASGRSEEWLKEQLHSQGIGQVREVFLASCDKQGSFTAYRMLEESVTREIFE